MSLKRFSAPGYLKEFSSENAEKWSGLVSNLMDIAARRPNVTQFYNELTEHTEEATTLAPLPWTAFPHNVRNETQSDRQRWQVADRDSTADPGHPRAAQDEYCEWSVQRNEDGKVTRVVFTCEVPEYWRALAAWQPDTLLEMYREHNPGFDIKREDLFNGPNGAYNTHNKWNNSTTTGSIMHLIGRHNTLAAAINLAADATVHRVDMHGDPVTDMSSLIRCSQFGNVGRNSDPFIGFKVNALARQGAMLTVANPPGLYINSFNASNFTTPDGTDAYKFWKFTRGMEVDGQAYWVRAVFEVPPEKGYVVGDIEDENGNEIRWGGQLADHVQIRITGQAVRLGLHTDQTGHRCLGAAAAAVPSATGPATITAKHAAFDPDVYNEEEDDRASGQSELDFVCY